MRRLPASRRSPHNSCSDVLVRSGSLMFMTYRSFGLIGFLILQSAYAQTSAEPTARERELLDRIAKLEKRLAAVEAKTGIAPAPPDPQTTPTASTPAQTPPAAIADSPSLPGLAPGTTLNFNF